jgi:predicted phage terminase large subunit-like protein
MNKSVALQYLQHKARADFYTYRRLVAPTDIVGKFYRDISRDLQDFYVDLEAGKAPELMINVPPQHGKSTAIVDFLTWLMGKRPDLAHIYTSFSERLGVRANMNVQRRLSTDRYRSLFPDTKINSRQVVTSANNYKKNSELIEIINNTGSFRNTTVGGAITGESITGIGIVDDPVKGRKEANSATIQRMNWDWYQDDFKTRFSETAGTLIIMTRWNVNDLGGKVTKEGIKVKKYQAFDTAGNVLFPELKSKQFIEKTKRNMAVSSWESLYQQNPVITGGNLIKTNQFEMYREMPVFKYKMMYADTAMKDKEQHDYSVFEVWGESFKGDSYLIDILRGKWEAPELLVQAKAFWNKHPDCRAMKVEDKVSGTGLIQTLKKETRIPVLPIPRSNDKVERANDVTPFIENGRVHLPEDAPFLSDFLAEVMAFPNGENDDQVDPMLDALFDIHKPGKWNYNDML